jgi:hypothetical protein
MRYANEKFYIAKGSYMNGRSFEAGFNPGDVRQR